MALGGTDEQELLGVTARKALEKAFPLGHAARLLDGEVADASWPEMARLGWFGIGIAEAEGGAGGDFTDQAVILHEMGRVLAPAAYAATAVGAAPVIAVLGSEAQRKAWLGPLLTGDRLGVLVAGSGSRVDAARDEGALVLFGEAGPLPGAAAAQTLVVSVRESDGSRLAILLDRDHPGVTITPVSGLDATSQLARVSLDAVDVDAGAVLAGDAESVVDSALDRLAVASVAELVGAGEKMRELAVEYAKVREQFGKPIGSFQAIKHMAADMVVRLESSRAVVGYAALSIAEGRDDTEEAASAAKAFAAEAIGLLSEDALQVHGGIGFTWEHPIHLYVRRAASVARLHGSGDFHRERVAAAIGL